MSIEYRAGWEVTHTANPRLTQVELTAKIQEALGLYQGADAEFLDAKGRGLGTNSLEKLFVSKGMHQLQGNDILPEYHVTLEYSSWDAQAGQLRPKRFHLYFLVAQQGKQKKLTYLPSGISHVDAAEKVIKRANL